MRASKLSYVSAETISACLLPGESSAKTSKCSGRLPRVRAGHGVDVGHGGVAGPGAQRCRRRQTHSSSWTAMDRLQQLFMPRPAGSLWHTTFGTSPRKAAPTAQNPCHPGLGESPRRCREVGRSAGVAEAAGPALARRPCSGREPSTPGEFESAVDLALKANDEDDGGAGPPVAERPADRWELPGSSWAPQPDDGERRGPRRRPRLATGARDRPAPPRFVGPRSSTRAIKEFASCSHCTRTHWLLEPRV